MKKEASQIILALYLLISPFLFVNFGYSPYEFPKFIFTLATTQLLVIILVFQKIILFKNKIILLTITLIIITFIADILGIDPRTSLLGSEYRFQGLLFIIAGFILMLSVNRINNKNLIYSAITLSAVAISIISIIQFTLINSGWNILNYNGRVIATLGNPNFIGSFLAISLPFALKFSSKFKLVNIILFCLIISGIFITFSLSGIIAAILVLISLTYKYNRQKNILVSTITILTIVIFGLILFSLKDHIYRFSPWDNRLLIWEKGLQSVIKHPLLGIGQENFEFTIPKKMFYKVDNAHNIFLEIAVSSGLFGMFTFLGILYLIFKKADLFEKLAILSFVITGFFNPLPILSFNLFWIIVGFISPKYTK